MADHVRLSKEFYFCLYNLCVHVHVQAMKFQRNCSLGYHHVVCIGRSRAALKGSFLLSFIIYAYICTCRRWNFKEIVPHVVCLKKTMCKPKSSIRKGYWVFHFCLTQFNMKCCSMLLLSNRNRRPVCFICLLQMTSLIVPNGKKARRPFQQNCSVILTYLSNKFQP